MGIHEINRGSNYKTTNSIDKDAYKLQDNFVFLHCLKILDDVIILRLQEEFPFNECGQTIIQKVLPHLASELVFDSIHCRNDPLNTSSCNRKN